MTVVLPLFLMISVYLSLIIITVTMGSAIAQQARDIALVRAVGAVPGQVRRAVAAQAVLVAVPSALAGVALGTLLGRVWIGGLVAQGVAPDAVTFHSHPAAVPVALAVTVPTSLIGGLIAAIRPSRVRPAAAMSDTVVPRRRLGFGRTLAGLLCAGGGGALAVNASTLNAEESASMAFLALLAMCVSAGLLGPALLRAGAPLARLFGPTGVLAADNMAVRGARSLSGALVPLALATAFVVFKISMYATGERENGGSANADSVWLDYSGTAVYTAFAAVAALTTLITFTMGRRREFATLRLAGATKRDALRVVGCEAAVVVVTGLVVAVVAAAAILVPMVHTSLGVWTPAMPAGAAAAVVLGVVSVVAIGMVLPAAVLLRRPAIECPSVDA
jgi:putative ABC transport system permease protein